VDRVVEVDRVNVVRGGDGREPLIPKHGGYRKLKSFQVAQLVRSSTVRWNGWRRILKKRAALPNGCTAIGSMPEGDNDKNHPSRESGSDREQPDMQAKATELVLEQATVLCKEWTT